MRRLLAAVATAALSGGLLILAPATAKAATFTVDTTADDPAADCLGENDCSLRGAVIAANAAAGSDTITLAPSTTYTLDEAGAGEEAAATGDLDVTSTITLQGTSTTIDANDLDRIFDVKPGASLSLSGVRLTDGSVSGAAPLDNSGGLILNQGNLTATSVELTAGSATRAGGAVEATAGSTTTLDDVAITGNTAGSSPGNGGGFHITGAGTVTITDSLVSGNSATNEGGGLWNSSAGTMSITDTDISDNEVTVGATLFNGGGGVFQQGGGTNDAPVAAAGSITISGGTITGNSAQGSGPSSGGGILNVRGDVSITGTLIAGNTASRAGGGIEANGHPVDPATTTLTGVILSANEVGASPGNGGGFHISGPGTTTVTESTVTDNGAANEGGGLWNSSVGTMDVARSLVAGNTANGDGDLGDDEGGGGLFNDGGMLTVADSTVSGNAASEGAGGGVLDVNGTITLIGTTVTDNAAPTGAGVFGFTTDGGDTVELGNSIVAGNDGEDCGGSVVSLGGNVVGPSCPDGADDVVTDDPRLGPLADNGGPTLTHLPSTGSPSLDVGVDERCTDTDQRGTARPLDGDGDGEALCDAGAVETAFVAAPPAPGPTPGPTPGPAGPGASPAQPVRADPTFTG